MKEIIIDAELLKTLTPNEFYMYSALRKAISESTDGKVDCYEVEAPRLTEKQRIKAIQSLEIKGLIRRRQCELSNSAREEIASAPVREEFAAVQPVTAPQSEAKEEIPTISEEDEAARLHKEAEEWQRKKEEEQREKDRQRAERIENEQLRAKKRTWIIETIYKKEGGDINQIVRDVDHNLNGTEKDNEFFDYMIDKIQKEYPDVRWGIDNSNNNSNSNSNDDDIINEIFNFDYSD